MKSTFNFKKTIIIEDPPIKFVKFNKRKQAPITYYLTGNLFFNRDVWIVNSIIKECKRYLYPYFKDLPKLDKMELDILFERNTTQWDLDNKGYFWEKILFDILKTPSPKQLKNAYLKGNDIISVNVLHDDTVKYVTSINKRFEKGGNRIHFNFTGRLLEEQKKLL